MFSIGGAPRSGTSLLSTLISQIPGVAVAHDSGIYYYLKLAAIRTLVRAQTGEVSDYNTTDDLMPINDLRSNKIFQSFLEASPADLLKLNQNNILRAIMDDWFRALWLFWVNDGNLPDPTKDRGTANHFLELLNGHEIINSTSIKILIQNHIEKFAISMNDVDEEGQILFGEKTPDNTVCADVIQTINPDCKFINLVRDPISVYAAKCRRMGNVDLQSFCHWFNVKSTFKFADQNKILKIYYHDILADSAKVMENVCSFLLLEKQSIDFSKGFTPPQHYNKYVGKSIDPSREAYLQSLVTKEDAKYIRENTMFEFN